MLGLNQLTGFGAGGRVPHSETITSNQSWVAPNGATNLITLYGIGQDGAAAYWTGGSSVGYELFQAAGAGAYGNTLDWSVLYNRHLANISALAAGGSGERSVTFYTTLGFITPDNSYWLVWDDLSQTRTVRGTATTNLRGSQYTSGQMLYSHMTDTYNGWDLRCDVYVAATTGSDTTGFSKTFSGGVGGAASGTTYNDVAITPGASYSLVVPSGGSITITYLADA